VVTNALVDLAASIFVSGGASAMVDRHYLHCAIRSILEARVGTFSSKAKSKLTNGALRFCAVSLQNSRVSGTAAKK
jgi:hypothetical protein